MIRHGDFASADFEAMRLASELQALSVEYINESFFAEEDLNLDNLTLANFMKEMEKARDGGPVAAFEFNRQLSKILQGVIPQVMNPQQPGQQTQPGQPQGQQQPPTSGQQGG